MNRSRSHVSLAALSALCLAASASPSATLKNTRFVDMNDPAGADPLNTKYNLGISDGGMQSAVGGGTMAKAAIISSFSGVRDIDDQVDDTGAGKLDDAGIGLNAALVAAAGRQAYLQ